MTPKRIGFIILIVATLIVCTVGVFNVSNLNAKKTIYIAVAGSHLTTKNGAPDPNSTLAGVEMAVDHINALGGIQGQQVAVISYNDEGNPETAGAVAREIVDSKVIAVVGHTKVDTSEAAGTVYDQAHIPAISASPNTDQLTLDHPYYFQMANTAEKQAIYLANYLRKFQEQTHASIISTDDSYNATIAQTFRNTFHGLGGTIVLEQTLPSAETIDEKTIDNAVNQFVALNPETQDPGIIFIATQEDVAVKLIVEMKRRGLKYPVMGANQMGTTAFGKLIGQQSEEKAQPGYFTDGILASRALIFDSTSGYANQFMKDYQQAYKSENPDDAVATGYDATLALLEAIRVANISGIDLRADREKVYQALYAINDPQTALSGITGPIYFDQNRTAIRSPRFGIFHNGQLVSAVIQYKPVESLQQVTDLQAQLAGGRIMSVGGDYVHVVNVVYSGIDILEIRDIDTKLSTYTMDFYLWFRYLPTLDENLQPDDYVFTNEDSLTSADLVEEDTADGMAYKTYRVIGTFKNQFDFHDYPFDTQALTIQLRNQHVKASEIEYVVDRIGMRYPSEEALLSHFVEGGAFNSLYGWKPVSAHAEQSTFSTESTLGNPQNFDFSNTTNFSLLNTRVEIHRASLDYVFKSLLPLLLTLLLAYITFYLPLGHSERLGIGSTALLTTAFFHLSLADSLPEIGYRVAMEYFFYASYGISTLIVLLETLSIRLENKGEKEEVEQRKAEYERARQKLNIVGRILYPSILVAVLIFSGLMYFGVINLSQASKGVVYRPVNNFAQNARASMAGVIATDAPPPSETVLLHFSNWRPEETDQYEAMFEAFHTYATNELGRDISITYEPIISTSYDTILKTQLDKNAGPDLFYVRPFTVDGAISLYLDPLTDLGIQAKFDATKRDAWKSKTGIYYAEPLMGVVQGIYYNQEIFEKLGLSLPQTWEQFLEAAQILKEAGYIPIANGLNQTEDSEMFMSLAPNFINGAEGRKMYMNTSTPGRCFNDQYATQVFQAIADLKPYLPDNVDTIGSYQSKNLFIQGKAAMLFGGSWDVTYFTEKARFRWSVFAPPAPAGNTSYVVFQPDVGIGLNRNSSHKEEAHLFLQWLMTDEALRYIADTMPGFYPLANTQGIRGNNPHNADFMQLVAQYPTDIRWNYAEISDHTPSGADTIRQALYEMMANDLSPKQAANRLQSGLAEWYQPAQTCN